MSDTASLWPPPRRLLHYYLLAWLPILLVYGVAVETDGIWTRGFDLWRSLRGTVRNMGLQMALLLLIWPATGWMERRGFSVARQLLNHAGLSLVLAVAYYALLWVWLLVEFDLATAEKARAYWFIWQIQFGMLAYAATAGGFHAYRAVERAIAQARAAEAAQTLLARSELAALRNKLNPHFLFNTLHSILALVRKDSQAAESALFRFSEMLRYLLDTERAANGGSADQVPLRDELAFTEQYLALEAIRLGERLRVERDIDERLLGTPVPALSLQPLVENSIKHAFNPRSQPGRLRLRVAQQAGRLLIEVADDGPGATLPAEGSGLGLRTVQRRLALQYGAAAGFDLRSAPGAGFTVTLSLPMP